MQQVAVVVDDLDGFVTLDGDLAGMEFAAFCEIELSRTPNLPARRTP